MKRLNSVLFLLLVIFLSASKSVLADVYPPPHQNVTKKLCAIYAQRYGISLNDRAACDQLHRNEDAAIRRMSQLRRRTQISDPCAAQDAAAIRTWAAVDPQRRMYLIRPAPIGPPATLTELNAMVGSKAQTQGGTSCRQPLNLR